MKGFTSDTRFVASADQVSTSVEDEIVILSLKDSTYYGLNPVGARVWELLTEPMTVTELVEALLAEFEVERERCEGDVRELVSDLAERGLVETAA